jgi:aryl-alcohol dehydrogenase-like predicted oxidoreductase
MPLVEAARLCAVAVHVAIVGARRASQLDGTLSGAEVRLSERERGEIARILSEAVPVAGRSPEGM